MQLMVLPLIGCPGRVGVGFDELAYLDYIHHSKKRVQCERGRRVLGGGSCVL